MMSYNYHSLEDYLISNPLTVDGQLDDGWGARFPVKGREVEATLLFSDISAFTKKTEGLSSTETLIFVNHFFSWITAEALKGRPGIVDKYIGDEMMVVFSEEFGSENAIIDALQTARWMAENDSWGFGPHIGIAHGMVTVGYVGTPMKYNCSVFGRPVAMAARCAGIKPSMGSTASIIFPKQTWGTLDFKKVFTPVNCVMQDGTKNVMPQDWELIDRGMISLKNMGSEEIIEVRTQTLHLPSKSAEDRARESLHFIKTFQD
jgi:hypothetical protein